jgi:hypothetical protein
MKTSCKGILRPRAFLARVAVLAAMPLLGGLPVVTPSWGAPASLAANAAAGLPAEITGGLGLLFERGGEPSAGLQTLGRPSLGALSARGSSSLFQTQSLNFPGALHAMQIPNTLSVVLWVRMDPGQPCQPLFGFGEPNGDYFLASTDSTGAPTLAFLTKEKVTQLDRARIGAVNLADGRLHAVIAVINFNSGLVRLYVDGRPETATTATLWRPREFGPAFALYALQGRTDDPGMGRGLLMPRIIPRELTEQEIAQLKPGDGESEMSFDAALGSRLLRDTLVEFWPPQFSHQLRWRPL